jgi:hypothetical protein
VPTEKNFYDYTFPNGECESATACKPGSTAFPSAMVDYAYSCGGAPGVGRDPIICVKPYCPPAQSEAGGNGSAVLPPSGGKCSDAATTEACITCCRQLSAPNYGGFELYASETCSACPSCSGLSPCGTNVTPPAGQACVSCLQTELSKNGVPASCSKDLKCDELALCMRSCPLK